MLIKITLTIIFLAVMIGVGLYTRKQASSVDGFVLGGRSVGPWLTAFAFGTSYFSAVVFVGYAGQFGWKYGLRHDARFLWHAVCRSGTSCGSIYHRLCIFDSLYGRCL